MIYSTEFTSQIKGPNYLKTFPGPDIEAESLEEANSYCRELGPTYRVVVEKEPKKQKVNWFFQLFKRLSNCFHIIWDVPGSFGGRGFLNLIWQDLKKYSNLQTMKYWP